MVKHPPMLLRSSPLPLREGRRHQWPGKAGSTVPLEGAAPSCSMSCGWRGQRFGKLI